MWPSCPAGNQCRLLGEPATALSLWDACLFRRPDLGVVRLDNCWFAILHLFEHGFARRDARPDTDTDCWPNCRPYVVMQTDFMRRRCRSKIWKPPRLR